MGSSTPLRRAALPFYGARCHTGRTRCFGLRRAGEVDADRLAVMRDSAGVQIVENRDPLWIADTRWTIDSAPSLTIGVEEGDPQREFFRLIDVRRLSDGRVAALNAGTSELRYFSPEGTYLCTSGREGAGPGEFEQMSWMQLLDQDSLLVYSFGAGGRLSLIGPDGKFVRTLSIPRVTDVQYARPNGMLSNGSDAAALRRQLWKGA